MTEAPRSAPLRLELARELQADSQSEQALKELQEAIRLDAQDSRPHAMMAAILLNRRRTDDAIEELRAAERLEPGNAAYQSVLGQALASQIGRSHEAAAALQAAVRLNPDAEEAQRGLAMIAGQQGEAQDITRDLLAEVRQNGNSAYSYVRLGVAQAATGDLVAAQKAFERSLEIEPKNGLAHMGMARLDFLRGDYAAAQAEIEAAKAGGAEPTSAFANAVGRSSGAKSRSGTPRQQRPLVLIMLHGLSTTLPSGTTQGDRVRRPGHRGPGD